MASGDKQGITATLCTCPPEPEHEGPGDPVRLPGRSHRRGCLVVQPIFDMQDRVAREHAEAHVSGGGILPEPGEREARRAQASVESLARRLAEMESALSDLTDTVEAIAAHLGLLDSGSYDSGQET